MASLACLFAFLSAPTLAAPDEQPAPSTDAKPIDEGKPSELPNDERSKANESPLADEKVAETQNREEALPKQEEPTGSDAVESAAAESLRNPSAKLPPEIRPTNYLLLPRVGDYRRGPFHVDPLEHALIKEASYEPQVGDKVRSASGVELVWQTEEKPPTDRLLIGGYAYTTFESPQAGTMLLNAQGCAALNLNGEWVVGNPYGIAMPSLPVRVKQGSNALLVHLAKPNARPTFSWPKALVSFDATNGTFPDVVATRFEPNNFEVDSPLLFASLPLINTSEETLTNLKIRAQLGDAAPLLSDIKEIPPRSIVRVPFKIRAFKANVTGDQLKLLVELKQRPKQKGGPEQTIAQTEVQLQLKPSNSLQTHTFVSNIDSTVQPYAYLPALEEEPSSEAEANQPRLVVHLHDAGDDCLALLSESEPLVGVHQIAPQGRGDYGFDWEDWSATDAFEAIADIRKKLGLKARPIAVAGQGMGGHGALWLATNYPDEFAAMESSFGWLNLLLPSEDSPNDFRLQKLNDLLNRRSKAADLFGLISNLENTAIRLHQGKEGSPTAMTEIRELRSELGTFHTDFSYQEKSISVVEQARVVAEALIASESRRNQRNPNEIEFVTPDLSVQAEIGWVKIDSVRQQGSLARVRILRDPELGTFRGSTENVQRLTLSLVGMKEVEKVQVRLDSQKSIRINWPARSSIVQFERDEKGDWGLPNRPQSFFRRLAKSPNRNGSIKSVFENNPLLIYGTQGNEEENRWAESKARYDADLFRYRGSGRLDFIADRKFSLDKYRERSLILYGNLDTNSVARRMLARSRVKVLDGQVDVGPRPELGDDLAVLLVQPRRDSRTASVALIGGTGIKGMQATNRLRYFWSGVHYPDLLIFGADALNPTEGKKPIEEVRAAGYLGPVWGLQDSDLVWRDVAL